MSSLSLASHVRAKHGRRTAAARRRPHATTGGVTGISSNVGAVREGATEMLVESETHFDTEVDKGESGAVAGTLRVQDSEFDCSILEVLGNRGETADGVGAATVSEPGLYGDLARRVQIYFRRQNETATPLYDLSSAEIEKHRSRLSRLSRSETQLLDRCRRKGASG